MVEEAVEKNHQPKPRSQSRRENQPLALLNRSTTFMRVNYLHHCHHIVVAPDEAQSLCTNWIVTLTNIVSKIITSKGIINMHGSDFARGSEALASGWHVLW